MEPLASLLPSSVKGWKSLRKRERERERESERERERERERGDERNTEMMRKEEKRRELDFNMGLDVPNWVSISFMQVVSPLPSPPEKRTNILRISEDISVRNSSSYYLVCVHFSAGWLATFVSVTKPFCVYAG